MKVYEYLRSDSSYKKDDHCHWLYLSDPSGIWRVCGCRWKVSRADSCKGAARRNLNRGEKVTVRVSRVREDGKAGTVFT